MSEQETDNTDEKEAETGNLYDKCLDPNCIMNIEKRLVRIEYPGEVKNVDKAIETLGGLDNIENSVAGLSRKLELQFHPSNKYNRSCIADKDFKPGILLKVKKNATKSDYSVEGVSTLNFSFNRLCDFQFLPLLAKQPETKDSDTQYIYDKIMPAELPTTEWLTNDESKNMDQFLIPVQFSHYDSPQTNLKRDELGKIQSKLKNNDISVKLNSKQQKSIKKVFGKNRTQISIFVNFKDTEIPTKPLESALRINKQKNWDEKIAKVKQLFEARPIWTKAAIRYNTGMSDEHSKIILPVVAYYFVNGPWRISWVKFGYDPRHDYLSRIYQTLDYRIRAADSSKVKTKRSYSGKRSIFPGPNQSKVSLKDDMSTRPRFELDERSYVLRPLTIPSARQMFYQLCDLLLPKIQEMITQLPTHQHFDICHPKNGWLPENFVETCRKVVNDHVMEALHQKLLEDNKTLQEKETKEKDKKKEEGTSLDYCNQMLSNIKKGIYKNVAIPTQITPKEFVTDELEMISLSSDEEEGQYTVNEIIQSSIPETMEEPEVEEENGSEEEQLSDEEGEIDLEVVEEINKMITEANKTD